MQIELYDFDYSKIEPIDQFYKFHEELEELRNVGPGKNLPEEAFDVIQSLVGYLITMGINIKKANKNHIEKLRRRHGR